MTRIKKQSTEYSKQSNIRFILKYRSKELMVFLIAVLITVIIIFEKEHIVKIWPFSKIFGEEKK